MGATGNPDIFVAAWTGQGVPCPGRRRARSEFPDVVAFPTGCRRGRRCLQSRRRTPRRRFPQRQPREIQHRTAAHRRAAGRLRFRRLAATHARPANATYRGRRRWYRGRIAGVWDLLVVPADGNPGKPACRPEERIGTPGRASSGIARTWRPYRSRQNRHERLACEPRRHITSLRARRVHGPAAGRWPLPRSRPMVASLFHRANHGRVLRDQQRRRPGNRRSRREPRSLLGGLRLKAQTLHAR